MYTADRAKPILLRSAASLLPIQPFLPLLPGKFVYHHDRRHMPPSAEPETPVHRPPFTRCSTLQVSRYTPTALEILLSVFNSHCRNLIPSNKKKSLCMFTRTFYVLRLKFFRISGLAYMAGKTGENRPRQVVGV